MLQLLILLFTAYTFPIVFRCDVCSSEESVELIRQREDNLTARQVPNSINLKLNSRVKLCEKV